LPDCRESDLPISSPSWLFFCKNWFKLQIIKKAQIIRISRGPQFKTKGGHILAMIFLCLFILSINGLFISEYLGSFVLLIISIILFYFVLDFHGIEVDTLSHKIRDYKVVLWFRFGKWHNMDDYKWLHLKQDHVVVSTSDYSDHQSETFHYYHIKLVDEIHKREIFLAEYKNYYRALHISKRVAAATGLGFRDFLKGGIRRKK
jgi:hypothetical protein